MRTPTVILTAILVLASASVAAAECAWVLWTYTHTPTVKGTDKTFDEFGAALIDDLTQNRVWNKWGIENAFNTRNGCLTAKGELWKAARAAIERTLTLPENKTTEIRAVPKRRLTVGDFVRRFLCLPDTIDPREKKQ